MQNHDLKQYSDTENRKFLKVDSSSTPKLAKLAKDKPIISLWDDISFMMPSTYAPGLTATSNMTFSGI